MTTRRLALFAAIAATVLAGCATTSASVSVADTIARDPQLSTLSGLVQKAGMAEMLKAGGPYTVFAPTNDAFKAAPAKAMDELAADPARLKAVLAYHVVPAKLVAGQVKNQDVKTAEGATLSLSKAGSFVTVEDAMVETADLDATNGVVHTIDRVLMPPRR